MSKAWQDAQRTLDEAERALRGIRTMSVDEEGSNSEQGAVYSEACEVWEESNTFLADMTESERSKFWDRWSEVSGLVDQLGYEISHHLLPKDPNDDSDFLGIPQTEWEGISPDDEDTDAPEDPTPWAAHLARSSESSWESPGGLQKL
jgi:hypothetical protein